MPHYAEPKNVKVKSVNHLTHDVLQIIAEKPNGIKYQPGQAADVSINKNGWEEEARPFTFISLQDENQIEFNTKIYPNHHGVTEQLQYLKPGDELLVGEVFGAINYKGDGIFIAGGAGITPMLAIFRYLSKNGNPADNKLLFANKTREDIIRKEELENWLGKENFINVLSQENTDGFEYGHINADLIRKHTAENLKYYYLCGPDPMVESIEKQLIDKLNIKPEFIVKEE